MSRDRDRKNRKQGRFLVFASWFFLAVFIPLIFFIYLIDPQPIGGFFYLYRLMRFVICCLIRLVDSFVNFEINLGGIKNVAMTIGLTGIFFAWLVAVLDQKECGVSVGELLPFEFKGYPYIIVVLILELVICIYLSSTWEKVYDLSPKNTLYILCLVVGISSSICVMLYLCGIFLFNSNKRRNSAFAYLENRIEEKLRKNNSQDSSTLLICREVTCWADELSNCLQNQEREYIDRFLGILCRFFPRENEHIQRLWMSECRDVFSRVLENTSEYLLLSFPAYFLSQCDDSSRTYSESYNEFIWLLLCYLFSISDAYARIDKNTFPEWIETRLHYIWYRMVGVFVEREEPVAPHLILAICAYEAIFPVRTDQEACSFFDLLETVKMNGPISSDLYRSYRFNIPLIAKKLCGEDDIIVDRKAERRFSWLIDRYFKVQE